jgi:hypothetical protein
MRIPKGFAPICRFYVVFGSAAVVVGSMAFWNTVLH